MNNEISFAIQRTPPSLNLMLRQHWAQRRETQKTWDNWIKYYWIANNKKVFMVPVELFYTLVFPKGVIRDVDNYIGGTKFITDALKKTFLPRDDSEWVKNVSISFRKGPEMTVIKIKEAR